MSADTQWDPKQYERFLRERSLPFFDLLDLIQERPEMRAADLGCGTGELTARLHETLKLKETVAIDSSRNMLEKSKLFVLPGLRFELKRVEDWEPEGEFDLVFSNAALHFVPGHSELISRLAAALSPRGQMAIHLPANQDFPTHRVASELASEEPFQTALGGYTHPDNRLPIEQYAVLFHKLGFLHQVVRLNVYGHILESREAVFEWVKGSLLNEYKARLDAPTAAAFLDEYKRRLLAELPDERPFFFTFKRILLWASKI